MKKCKCNRAPRFKMIIENDGTLKTNDTYKINDEITLKIPLTEKVVMITQDYKDTEKNIVEQKKKRKYTINSSYNWFCNITYFINFINSFI